MELQNLALKNRISGATVETKKQIFLYVVKNKIQYGVNKKGVMFNVSELAEKHKKAINKIIDKSENTKNEAVEIDKNLLLEL